MSSAWSRVRDAGSSLGSAVLSLWNAFFQLLPIRLQVLLDPVVLMVIMLSFLPGVLLQNPFLLLTNPKAFQHKLFGAFWHVWGPEMAKSPDQTPYIASLLGRASGTVLELGPGAGDQMRHYAKPVYIEQITRIIGAEPNAVMHPSLLQKAREIGLSDDKYLALEAGAEPAFLLPALQKAGLLESSHSIPKDGLFDTIVCVKSMCSAPQDQMTDIVRTIQALLKPGGQFLFFEHVDNGQDPLTMAWAWILGFIWPILMGNCHLDGKVDVVVRKVGGWSFCDTRNVEQFKGYNVFRYCVGICKK